MSSFKPPPSLPSSHSYNYILSSLNISPELEVLYLHIYVCYQVTAVIFSMVFIQCVTVLHSQLVTCWFVKPDVSICPNRAINNPNPSLTTSHLGPIRT